MQSSFKTMYFKRHWRQFSLTACELEISLLDPPEMRFPATSTFTDIFVFCMFYGEHFFYFIAKGDQSSTSIQYWNIWNTLLQKIKTIILDFRCVWVCMCAIQVFSLRGKQNCSSHWTKIPLQNTVIPSYRNPSDQHFEFWYNNMTVSISKSLKVERLVIKLCEGIWVDLSYPYQKKVTIHT